MILLIVDIFSLMSLHQKKDCIIPSDTFLSSIQLVSYVFDCQIYVCSLYCIRISPLFSFVSQAGGG